MSSLVLSQRQAFFSRGSGEIGGSNASRMKFSQHLNTLQTFAVQKVIDGGTRCICTMVQEGMLLSGSQVSDKECAMPYYVHEVPGRLRIKIPTLKRNVHEARKLKALLGMREGVSAVSVNHMTGSMLIHYDTSIISSSEIFRLLNRGGYIEAEKVTPSVKKIDQDLKKLGRLASKALVGIVLDRALEGTPLSILTAFI